MKTVRINPATLLTKDASEIVKKYEYDGQVYSVTGVKEVSVPDEVAAGWVAHDTDIEIWDDNER